MPRSVWNGAISFGLVSIPVRLYPATEQRDPRFHMVDRRTGRRVRYRRVVEESEPPPEEPWIPEAVEPSAAVEPKKTVGGEAARVEPISRGGEREVAYEELARGYDVGGGQHVVVEREDLEALRPERSRIIEVEHFVSLSEVDPMYFEKSYFLTPADEAAEKPYALLRVAMERTGRVAVGRFVLRSREHLVVIRPTAGILGLETLYFADEVRRPADQWVGTVQAVESHLADAEVRMAEHLIEALSTEWDPAQYQDPYRERVLDLVRSRAPTAEPAPVEEPAAASIPDLMEALRASVEAIKSPPSKPRSRIAGGVRRARDERR
jgi:DNA end-binding protein Ku